MFGYSVDSLLDVNFNSFPRLGSSYVTVLIWFERNKVTIDPLKKQYGPFHFSNQTSLVCGKKHNLATQPQKNLTSPKADIELMTKITMGNLADILIPYHKSITRRLANWDSTIIFRFTFF